MTLCLRVNATTGGTDFISIYLSQKRGVDSFNLILGFNAVILLVAGYFFGWDKALYSIIFQYTSTQTLRLLYRNYQQETLFIVTDKWDEVSRAIYDTCRHGSTLFSAALRWENFYGTQFHPEKSGSVGAAILQNFLAL